MTKLKQIYKHNLELTQIGEEIWPTVQQGIRKLYDLVPNANPMHVRQMLTSALMMESCKRITKAKKNKAKEKLGSICYHGAIEAECRHCRYDPL